MLKLARYTQFICCFVSMVLTSLFAFSLSGISIDSIDDGVGGTKEVLSVSLFVLIGACIDFGKYLFWAQRDKSFGYLGVSLILTAFSLLASCAFFVSAEMAAIDSSRLATAEYQAHQQRLASVRLEIDDQESLMSKRLDSQYHSQWGEGEKNSENLSQLRESLANLIQLSPSIGRDEATRATPITAFFLAVSEMMNVEISSVRNMFFGLLAFLLEINTLGAISLSGSLRAGSSEMEKDVALNSCEKIEEDFERREKVVKLSSDILNSNIEPVLRKIKAAQYGLDLHEIKQVLTALYQTGLIDKDARKSYKLKTEKI